MHSVCVCQQHQNVKLLIAAIPDNCDYKEYLAKLVCSIENRTCMMQSCDSCPQGGVISPVLFNLYLDNLLISLKQSGLGCHINGTYMGALGYADDITLTCPSLYGLNSMLDICNQFAKNNHVIFNTKKTICIKYGDAVKPQECAKLNDTRLSWGGGKCKTFG